jgi:hypothetical protein
VVFNKLQGGVVARSFGQMASAEQMLEFLLVDFVWKKKLELIAGRQGDEVKFNIASTLQPINTDCMTFQSSGPAGGFAKVAPLGSTGDTSSFMRIGTFQAVVKEMLRQEVVASCFLVCW